jgi:subfamily B ATP-binding cassette protein MsbA
MSIRQRVDQRKTILAGKKKKPRVDSGEVIAMIRRVLAENGRSYIPQYALAVVLLLLVAGTTAFSAWIMRDVINQIFYNQRFDLIAPICGAIIAAFVIRGLADYGQAVLLAKIGNNLVARYQRRVFDHLMKLGVSFFNDIRSGRLAAQINHNIHGIRDLLGVTLTAIARDFISLVALVGVMISQDPVLSAIAFLIGPPLILSVAYLMRRLRQVAREAIEINSQLVGALQETTQGIAIVKAFTMEEQLSQKMAVLISKAEGRANKIARVSERTTPITEVLAGLVVAGVLAYGGWRVSVSAEPPGAIFAFITALLLAYDPARRLAKVQLKLERALVNARMIYELLDLEPKQGDAPDAKVLQVTAGEVRFDRVAFSYSDDLPVLRGVSFTAAAGNTTAIVGGSGAGKSTLIALLQRFYDLDSGAIEIDGQDISTVTKRSLRQSIAYVSQQPYLFEGSIRDNIRYGRPGATDAEVEQAAMLAQADEFIRQQIDGYDTAVGENGVTLSGGQRQRLSIARAILRDAPILLLDEATSALDNESEAKVQEALLTVMKDRTTIVIAHRLSTVVNADRIVVLEDGRLVEEGTHRSLLQDENGVYARYYRMHDEQGLGLVDDLEDALPEEAPAVAMRNRA